MYDIFPVLSASKSCAGDYGFTFLSDRYIAPDSVSRRFRVDSLQDCLADCLNQGEFKCRSLAFNRTSSGECGEQKCRVTLAPSRMPHLAAQPAQQAGHGQDQQQPQLPRGFLREQLLQQ